MTLILIFKKMKIKKLFIYLTISMLILTCSKEEEKDTSIIQSPQQTETESQSTSVTQYNLTVSAEQGGSVSTEGGTMMKEQKSPLQLLHLVITSF